MSEVPSIEDIAAELESISDEPDHLEPVDEAPPPEPEPPAAAAPSEVEALAEELGWRRDFNGREAVSAKEYIKRQQGFLRDSSRQLRELKEATAKHGEALVRVQKQALEQARQALQAEFDEAVRLGDTRAANAASERLADTRIQEQKLDQPPPDLGLPPDVKETTDRWVEDNAWFKEDEEARGYAEVVYRREVGKLGRDDPTVILPKITDAVRKRFPEHFEAAREPDPRPTPPAVNGTPRQSNVVNRTAGKGWNDMDAVTRAMGAAIVNEPSFMPHLKTAAEKRAAYAAAYFKENP